jgi:L-ascorbate oxidase
MPDFVFCRPIPIALACPLALLCLTLSSCSVKAEPPRPLSDPPLLEIKRATLEALTKAQQQAGAPQPDEGTLNWDVVFTRSQLWNPTTGRWDQVNLRSYQGSKVDPQAPFVAPTLRVFPGETIRATLNNKLPADPSCLHQEQGVNNPHCFNGTNMHTHGLWINPAGNSDNVLISIDPTVSFQYEYNIPADHPAGTFWYHPHRHGSTAIQVASGMAGALIIQGTRQPTPERNGDLDLLLTSSAHQTFTERTMVFQQIQYGCYSKPTKPGEKPVLKKNPDGTYRCDPGDVGEILDYSGFGPGGWNSSGRYTSINGVVQPFLTNAKAGQTERWRMVHAGVRDSINLKVVKLTGQLLQGQILAADEQKLLQKSCTGAVVPQHQIAADGLTLAAIDSTEVTVFQPGYRWDTLMMFPETGQYCLIDEAAAASANVDQTPSEPRLLGIVQVAAGPNTGSITEQLIKSAKANINPAMQNAVIADLQAGLKLSHFVPHVSLAETPNKQHLEFNIETVEDEKTKQEVTLFEIDGEPYQPGRIDRNLILGNTDEWILTSKLASHPFHIHVNPFQVVAVLDPNGKDVSTPDAVDDFDTKKQQPDPQYRGLKGKWKDTLWVKNAQGKSYTVIVRTKYQRYIGDFVLHCHILDHEDQGMMQNVRISLPNASGGVSKGHH